jgi:hypothetical protein
MGKMVVDEIFRKSFTWFFKCEFFVIEVNDMGNLKKKRILKMNKHKRKKRSKAIRHRKRTWSL